MLCGQHGAVVSTGVSQQEIPGFESRILGSLPVLQLPPKDKGDWFIGDRLIGNS